VLSRIINVDYFTTFIQVLKMLPILIFLIISNIVSGTINSIINDNLKFNKKKFKDGIITAIGALFCITSLSIAFDVLDLSNIGFTPVTIVSTCVLVYVFKIANNLVKLLHIDKIINIENPYPHSDDPFNPFDCVTIDTEIGEEEDLPANDKISINNAVNNVNDKILNPNIDIIE